MAITIRNKETEALIRELGKRWDAGPSATIRRLAERELRAKPREEDREAERVLSAMRDLRRRYPPPAEPMTQAELKRERDALFEGPAGRTRRR